MAIQGRKKTADLTRNKTCMISMVTSIEEKKIILEASKKACDASHIPEPYRTYRVGIVELAKAYLNEK